MYIDINSGQKIVVYHVYTFRVFIIFYILTAAIDTQLHLCYASCHTIVLVNGKSYFPQSLTIQTTPHSKRISLGRTQDILTGCSDIPQ